MSCFPRWRSGLLVAALVACCGAFELSIDPVPLWNPVEVLLTAESTYSNGYLDVDVNGTFTAPSGVVLQTPGFWNGGQAWVVRFAPNETGVWHFQTDCSTGDKGLCGVAGQFTAVPYTGALRSYIHGFLKPSGSNLYLAYDDGTPFFWLGDTHWSGFSSAEHFSDSNDPRFKTMFEGILQTRRAQAETFSNNDEGTNPPSNEGGYAWNNDKFFEDLNVDFWKAIDNRVEQVVQYDFVVSIALGIGRSLKDASMEPAHRRLSLYLLARYAAYPVVWITAQEYCASACSDCWARIAEALHAADPYHRATSMHNCQPNPIVYHGEPWYSFVTLQLGHNMLVSVDHWLAQYAARPKLPVIEDEANYEQIIKEYGGGAEWMTRQAAWQAIVGGAFGYTYGGQGLWWGCWNISYNNGNCGPPYSSEYRVWNNTLQFPIGGYQLMAFAKLWKSVPWWTMMPDDSVISWLFPPANTQKPFQKTNVNHTHIIAYLPNTTATYTGTITGLNPALSYHITWFDPRSGKSTTIATATSGCSFNIPEQPSIDDWALVITPAGSVQPRAPVALATAVNTSGHLRNDTTSGVGAVILVGDKPLLVTAIGRYFIPGNQYVHRLRIIHKTFFDTIAEAFIDMQAGTPDALGFKHVNLTSPVVLNAFATYYIVSDETEAGDSFYDNIGTTIKSTSAATIVSAVFENGDDWVEDGPAGSLYGPVDIVYSTC